MRGRMVNKAFLIGLTGLIFLSCANTKELTEVEKLNGNYTWVKTEGGFMGKVQTPETLGYTQSLEITDSELVFYEKEKEKRRYNYTAIDSVDWNKNEMILFQLEIDREYHGYQRGDTLILAEPFADGQQFTYVRQKTVDKR